MTPEADICGDRVVDLDPPPSMPPPDEELGNPLAVGSGEPERDPPALAEPLGDPDTAPLVVPTAEPPLLREVLPVADAAPDCERDGGGENEAEGAALLLVVCVGGPLARGEPEVLGEPRGDDVALAGALARDVEDAQAEADAALLGDCEKAGLRLGRGDPDIEREPGIEPDAEGHADTLAVAVEAPLA